MPTSKRLAFGTSLSNRNFRKYAIGQGVSQAGQWVQFVAEVWIILELSDSGIALGIHSILRFAPILFVGAFTGIIGDRFSRIRVLIITQSLHTISTTTLAIVVWFTTPTLILIYGIVLTQGLINAVDNPVRRSFIRDLTTDEELPNAVSLHSSIGTVTRGIGPVIAGTLIVTVGIAWCFAINAASYVAVLVSLIIIDRKKLRESHAAPAGKGQIRAGFRYAKAGRTIRVTLIMSAVMGISAWQWNVILPVYATEEFGGNAQLFGYLVFAFSLGSFMGAVYTARLARHGGHHLRVTGALLAVALTIVAVAPVLPVAFAGLWLLGGAGASFIIGAQSRLQLAVEDEMTTRVMALYSVAFTGSKPIGGIIAGLVIDVSGSRAALALGAVMAGTATWVYSLDRRRRDRTRAQTLPSKDVALEPNIDL
jgi:MFS family permease